MGGIETHLQNLCRELAKSYRVTAIVASDGPANTNEMDGDVSVRRIATLGNISSAPVNPGMVWAIKQTKPDLLHIHLPNPLAIVWSALSCFRGPIITTWHSDIVRQKAMGRMVEPLSQWLLKRSTAVICTSQRYMESSLSLHGFHEKCAVIPYGIPWKEMADAEPEAVVPIRQQFGSRLIIAVGRLVYYKGFEYLIEAMRGVQGKLLIIGDGPMRSQLQTQIIESNLRDRVQLLGEIQNADLAPYYRAADVFALPSIARSEAFGIVQLEAMASGLPVVNTDLDSGVPSVSRHCETGFTVPPRDPAALADVLNTLLADRGLRASFGDAAQRRVQKDFSVEVMAERTSDVYWEVLANWAADRGLAPRTYPAPTIPVPQEPAVAAKRTAAS
jgi:rhamnosyl/mannosyltransferase